MKILKTVFLLVLISIKAQAQSGVTLNVNLYPIQTLVVNASQAKVNLEYTTQEHYKNGVMSEQKDHLTIYSTSGFQVKVNKTSTLSSNASLNNIAVIPSSGSRPVSQENVVYSQKNISEEQQPIITTTKGAIDKNFNISYKGTSNNSYIAYNNIKNSSTLLTYDIVYTIISQ